jgi:hypothetical protein
MEKKPFLFLPANATASSGDRYYYRPKASVFFQLQDTLALHLGWVKTANEWWSPQRIAYFKKMIVNFFSYK